MSTLVIGHRGYSAKYPENTLLSLLAALYYGADGVELDVWLSGDGNVVVIHDPDTKRVAGADLQVKKSTLRELRQVYLGYGQVIPTLEEVYQAIPRDKLLLVEIKDLDAVEPVVRMTEKYGRVDNTIIISFYTDVLVRARELSKDVKIGLNIDSLDKAQWAWNKRAELNIYSINPPIEGLKMYRLFVKGYLKLARSTGLKVYTWTVNDVKDAVEWREDVDGIVTDYVEDVVKAVKKP